ncbi:hypothetical protein EI94DRAFT_1732750 [Lactarius quietus]|nr:hypothetical protein EI94DRAFT_1732750 [Lactarius quietus]
MRHQQDSLSKRDRFLTREEGTDTFAVAVWQVSMVVLLSLLIVCTHRLLQASSDHPYQRLPDVDSVVMFTSVIFVTVRPLPVFILTADAYGRFHRRKQDGITGKCNVQ